MRGLRKYIIYAWPLTLPIYVLQPLDVGVFKSFKSVFSKGCCQYMAKNPGRVITEDILATIVGDAFAQSHTPFNTFGGFKKSGIYPVGG